MTSRREKATQESAAATAAEQLRRLLLALPALADDQVHPVAEIAKRVGTSDEVIRRDLTTLVNRVSDEPGGFTEGVSLLLSANTVQFVTPSGHFRRPMALTRTELHALDLGLAMLAQEAPPDERVIIGRARDRVRRAAVTIPADGPASQTERAAALGREVPVAIEARRNLQACIRARRVATIHYRSASSTATDERRVRPLGVAWARGSWYLIAWCERNDGLRVFRCDRVLSVRKEAERFAPPDNFALESVLREGKVLTGEEVTRMRVRYSARVARWIAERERVSEAPDGSVTIDTPVLDEAWAVRRVLRYGPDALVESPESIRRLVVAQLRLLTTDADD
jgi:predicted DNA-binding transcriptional regulator YafY